MGRLDGGIILVSGGARGMGAAHVAGLAAEGAKVIIGDVLEEEGRALAANIGANARFIRLDVTREADWAAAETLANESFGELTSLINNAGVIDWGAKMIQDTAPDDFRRVVDINLNGVFLGMRAAVPSMRRGGGGVIVNVSSTAGLMAYAARSAYVASKWGVRGLTKAAALELGEHNIRVVSVHPGAIRTPMTANLRDDTFKDRPIPRIGETEEVTKLMIFLIADATYSTGSEFVVDGGAALMGPGRANPNK